MSRQFGLNVDLLQNELLNARFQNLAADPSTGKVGYVYYNTTSSRLRVCTTSSTATPTNAVFSDLYPATATVSDATTTTNGIIRLAGDLGGSGTTAAAPIISANAIDAGKVSASLKPSGTATAGTEALRALGTTAGTAAAGDDSRLQTISKEWKDSVVAASTANVSISSAPSTLDGVSLAANDRVLLKNQTTVSERGIYVFNGAGSAFTRATDADTAAKLTLGTTVRVDGNSGGGGLVNGGANFTFNGGTFTSQVWSAAIYVPTNTPVGLGGLSSIYSDGTLVHIVDASSAEYTIGNGKLSGLTATPTGSSDATNKAYTDTKAPIASPVFTGDPQAPTPATTDNDTSIATTAYVQAAIAAQAQGLKWKTAVQWGSSAAQTYTIAAGAVTSIAGTTFGGGSPAIGDRLLIFDAPAATGAGGAGAVSTQPANGIYVVTANTTNLTVSRATDADTATKLQSAVVFVDQGTLAGRAYNQQSDNITLGTTGLFWSFWQSAADIVADELTLQRVGNTLSVKPGAALATPTNGNALYYAVPVGARLSRARLAGNGSTSSWVILVPGVDTTYPPNVDVYEESTGLKFETEVTVLSNSVSIGISPPPVAGKLFGVTVVV